MRALGRDAALGRHARVPERVRALELVQAEPLGEDARPADLLVDLDHPAGAHHAQLRVCGAHPRLRFGGLGFDGEDNMSRARRALLDATKRLG